jgi:hypothetical protein
MLIATFLAAFSQQPLAVEEILAQPWEGNQDFIYEQILDPNTDGDTRGRLASYAIIFDGHHAIDVLHDLLQPSTTPTLLHALLREWRSCVDERDVQLLTFIAENSPPRTAFLALRNLASLATTAADYIPLLDLAVQIDITIAERLLTYLPALPDDGSFQDYLTAQVSTSFASYRTAILNKATEYFETDSLLRLYRQSVGPDDFRQQAIWMPIIARMPGQKSKLAAADWFWSADHPYLATAAAFVAKALESSQVLDGRELSYMNHPLLTYEQSCRLLAQRISSSAQAVEFAVEYFDEFPRTWQKIILERLSANPTASSKELVVAIATSMRFSETVRAEAIRSASRHFSPDESPPRLSELLHSSWGSYEVAEALIELVIVHELVPLEQLVDMIEAQSELADMKVDLKRAVYNLCRLSDSNPAIKFIAEQMVSELQRVQASSKYLLELPSLSMVMRVDNNFSAVLKSYVHHAGSNDIVLGLSTPNFEVNKMGAVLALYAASKLKSANRNLASLFLTISKEVFDEQPGVWALRANAYGAQILQNQDADDCFESLAQMSELVEQYEFAVRESFAPHASGWHDLSLGVNHRAIFARAVSSDSPMLCQQLLAGVVEIDLLMRAAQMCSNYRVPRNQQALSLSVQLAQRAVDMSPFSSEAHQQLFDSATVAGLEQTQLSTLKERLKRSQFNN